MIGVYVHVPFCEGKCPYCDFYSVAPTEKLKNEYTSAVISDIGKYKGRKIQADTLYLGGGTPILLGAENISRIIRTAKDVFGLENAEITIESNPSFALREELEQLAQSGINRLSLGMQSAVEKELKSLGRRHSPSAVKNTVETAKKSGISNISVDWMIGTENQTAETLRQTADFIAELDISHVSCYMLKIEQGTPYYKRRKELRIADEDESAELYLQMCGLLEKQGFKQYEISNFAKNDMVSRHNLKYWNCEEYLGFGPAAHSFFNGKRFFYQRSLTDYINGTQPVGDGDGGDFEEYIMLRLRLADGIEDRECIRRFGHGIDKKMRKKAELFQKNGLCFSDDKGIRLTPKGFLLSNSIIFELLDM